MKKNKGEKRKKVHLIFDEIERAEFLTGSRKRNLARKVKAKLNLDKKLKEEMKKIKHNQKEAFEEAIKTQRTVPEVEHLVEPVTYDLPDHTVTISEVDNSPSTFLPLAAGKTQEEIEKLRKMIKEMKTKRAKVLQKSNIQFEVKKLQKKSDKLKAKREKKQYQRNLKHMKKKHKKKLSK
ncbi:nucleolar protein 12 [Parasteatoda tepidariorum]|uniref:nucleolar protein 12 n=1 Tax=Parasteatoda tepidariorum TaxID=114398 RepID=UPI001C71B3E5|nr:nucleolar protein 12 [Parasteatoda tepidariorum]